MITNQQLIAFIKKANFDRYTHSDYEACCKVEEACPEVMGNVRFCDGASKVCVVFVKQDIVIKWSTCGNEAEQEVEMYERAKTANLAKFFPKTEILCEHNGVVFVRQEKIDFSCREMDNRTARKFERISKTATPKIVSKMDRQFKKADHGAGYRRDLDTMWAKMAIVLYGKKACKALSDFVQENGINDLHRSNLGYKNGKPIILDFSGFRR